MEQPREPIFYPNEETTVFTIAQKNTLHSIDATLQRIEKLLIQFQKQFCALDGRVPCQPTSKGN